MVKTLWAEQSGGGYRPGIVIAIGLPPVGAGANPIETTHYATVEYPNGERATFAIPVTTYGDLYANQKVSISYQDTEYNTVIGMMVLAKNQHVWRAKISMACR